MSCSNLDCDYSTCRKAHDKLKAALPDLVDALQREQEWRDRDRDGALDPEWSYEIHVGNYRRAALAKAGLL
jgi:hypothetical protein